MAPPARPPLLCSASPRRAELLAAAGFPFERGPAPAVDETPPPGLHAPEVARALAVRKALAASARAPGRVVVTADTTVVVGDEILGKPADAADAARMLRRLSGRAHLVVTGVAAARDGRVESGDDRATVVFRPLSDAEIAAYAATAEPLDKAGGYAIQGGAAGFVARVEGRLDTVVGLPVPLVGALVASLARQGAGAGAAPAGPRPPARGS